MIKKIHMISWSRYSVTDRSEAIEKRRVAEKVQNKAK